VIEQLFKRVRPAWILAVLLLLPGLVPAQILPQNLYPPLKPPAEENGSKSTAPLAPQVSPTVDQGATSAPPPGGQTIATTRDQLVVVAPAPAGRIFGSQLFGGTFRGTLNPGFNPNHVIAAGDRIQVRMWGAFSFDGSAVVDPKGNIFIPNVGPVAVAGVANRDLNKVVETGVRKVFKASTGVYAALDVSQPVKVFVTGFVRQPGLYSGLSSDSAISYLDKAGGVDQDRGSYIDVVVKRDGQIRQRINLYAFLLEGTLQLVQFQDGDVIVVGPRQHTFAVSGDVFNANDFEFDRAEIPLASAMAMAKPKPGATHVSVIRRQGSERRTEYYPLNAIDGVTLRDGDSITVTTDRYPGTIQVRVEGAHSGEHAVVLPYGSTLGEVLGRIKSNPMTNLETVQLFRRSVMERQKEMLAVSLRKLEETALSARSATIEEANLRSREADLLVRFVERAKTIQPKGQVVLDGRNRAATLLEDGDLIVIPEKTSLVMVHGEVLFPNAVSWQEGAEAVEYIAKVGGFTQGADTSKVILLRQNGLATLAKDDSPVAPGDEIMVLPKIESKNIEVTRSLTQILYQIAFTAGVAFGL
jgi:protein involved in polysaccharide export with SLBB domain